MHWPNQKPSQIKLFESQNYAAVRNLLVSLNLYWEKRKPKKDKEERGPKAAPKLLRVTFPDGKVVCHDKGAETIAEVVEIIGPEKVAELNISVSSQPFVSKERYERNQTAILEGWLVTTHSSTDYKKRLIEKMSEIFGLGLVVDEVSK